MNIASKRTLLVKLSCAASTYDCVLAFPYHIGFQVLLILLFVRFVRRAKYLLLFVGENYSRNHPRCSENDARAQWTCLPEDLVV